MALVSGRGGGSNRYSGSISSIRQRMGSSKQKIQGYKSRIQGYNTSISDYKNKFKVADDAFYETQSGKNILALNKAFGFEGRGKKNLLDKFTDQTKEGLYNLAQAEGRQSHAQAEYDERMKSDYKSGHSYSYMADKYTQGGSFLSGFFKIITGQEKIMKWKDTTEEKRGESRRRLAEAKSNVANIKGTASGIGDMNLAQVQSSLKTYGESLSSDEAKKYQANVKNLGEGLQTVQTAQETTLASLKSQQAESSRLESTMAHLTSLFAGAKRQEQMELAKGGKGKGKQKARVGQGYA